MLAGGAFCLLRRPAVTAGSAAARGLTTTGQRCSESLEEAPWQPLPPDSETEGDEASVGAAQAGGTVLFGASKVREASARLPGPSASGPARWIGSASHSGDWTRASLKQTKQPVQPSLGVWGSIVAACRDDSARLGATISSLHTVFQQNKVAPPLPAFNKLLELCVKAGPDAATVQKMEDIMSGAALTPDEETYRLLDQAHSCIGCVAAA